MTKLPHKETVAQRLFRAIAHFEARRGSRLTRDEVGAAVGKSMKRDDPYSGPTVTLWLQGAQVPSVAQIEGLARFLGVNPGWLAFGEAGRDALEKYNPASEPPDNYYTDITKPEKKADPVTKRRRA